MAASSVVYSNSPVHCMLRKLFVCSGVLKWLRSWSLFMYSVYLLRGQGTLMNITINVPVSQRLICNCSRLAGCSAVLDIIAITSLSRTKTIVLTSLTLQSYCFVNVVRRQKIAPIPFPVSCLTCQRPCTHSVHTQFSWRRCRSGEGWSQSPSPWSWSC